MGNVFELTVVGNDEQGCNVKLDAAIAEIQRTEALLSTCRQDSDTNRIDQAAGLAPVTVQQETFNLIQRSLTISHLTQGAFDISYGSIDKQLWNFDKTMTSLPDAATARQSVHLINYRHIILNPTDCSVFLKSKGMRIGFGALAKAM